MTGLKKINLILVTADDDPKHRKTISDYSKEILIEINQEYNKKCIEIAIDVQPFDNVKSFMDYIEKNTIHVLVMDLKFGEALDDRSGWKCIDAVMALEIVPTIVYSAFAYEEPDERFKNIFIAMVSKGDAKIGTLLKKMILIKIRLILEKERILNEFHNLSLEALHSLFDPDDLENLSEKVLSDIAVSCLRTSLVNKPLFNEGGLAQESIFLPPPAIAETTNSIMLGDIIRDCMNRFFVVISPSCDLVKDEDRENKIQTVLLLPCFTKSENMRQFKGLSNGQKENKISGFIRRGIVKVQKCPKKLFSVDYILFSFKDYFTLPYSVLIRDFSEGKITKVSTIATPYAESLQNLFIRDFSRIGTPDTLNVDKEEAEGKKFVRQT
jgi:hypothetical protein